MLIDKLTKVYQNDYIQPISIIRCMNKGKKVRKIKQLNRTGQNNLQFNGTVHNLYTLELMV